MKFGYSEVIQTPDFTTAQAVKNAYRHETLKSSVAKEAESHKVSTEAEALAHAIKAVKDLSTGSSEYACIELFTDNDGLTRINICHMKETL